MYTLTVLDENHHIKHTFTNPTKLFNPEKKMSFPVKAGEKSITLFDLTKVNKAHFEVFDRGFEVFNESGDVIEFEKAKDKIVPTIILKEPPATDTIVKVIFHD